MTARALAGVALLAVRAFADDVSLDPALAADDACLAGSGECGVELRQLRGEVNSVRDTAAVELSDTEVAQAELSVAQAIIGKQLEENKKYEVALDDESGTVCHAPKGYKTTGMSCGGGTKCCTSQPSYLAGQPHASQAHLSLYSICCSISDHCKYDTIFVSCASGPGPDDYSGVIAGLEEEAQTIEQAEDEVNAEQDVADVATEEDVVNVDVSQGEAATTEEAEENDAEGKKKACLNHEDMSYWKDPGAKHFHNDLTECGLKCNGVEECSSACMEDVGYTKPCASCMGKIGMCSMSTCSHKCINKGCQSIFNGCFNGTETEIGKCTTYWMQHNCVANKDERVYTMSDDCITCMHDSHCGHDFEKCSGLELDETEHEAHKHIFRWWLNK